MQLPVEGRLNTCTTATQRTEATSQLCKLLSCSPPPPSQLQNSSGMKQYMSSLAVPIGVAEGSMCHLCSSRRCPLGSEEEPECPSLLQNVGCDYEIDSYAVEDRCGVCRGDGSTCQTVTKTFEEREGLGEEPLFVGLFLHLAQSSLEFLTLVCGVFRSHICVFVRCMFLAAKCGLSGGRESTLQRDHFKW